MEKEIANNSWKILSAAAALVFTSGCLPDESLSDLDITPSPTISAPLLKSTLSLSDLLSVDKGGLLQIDENNAGSVSYSTSFSSEPISNYFQGISDQYYNKSISLDQNEVTKNETIPFDLSGNIITAIGCKTGKMTLDVSSSYHHNIEATLTFPNIISPADESLELHFSLDNSGSANETKTLDFTGYTIKPDENEVSYSIELKVLGSDEPIAGSGGMQLSLSFTEIDFSYLEGNFQEFEVPIEEGMLEIPVLTNAVQGNVALQPTITLNFMNSIGIPAVADFSNITIKNKNGLVTLQDQQDGDFFHDHYAFPYPVNRTDLAAHLNYEINGQNSNINEVFTNIPEGVNYALGITVGSQIGQTNFIADTSRIHVEAGVEIPLMGSFDLTVKDTLEVDFTDFEDLEELKLLIRTENSFPIDGNLQIHFLDDNQQFILGADMEPIQLFDNAERVLQAATIINSATGETSSSITDPSIEVVIDKDEFQLIQQASYMLISVQLNSVSDNDNQIRLYSFYEIQVDIALSASL